jgi:hypothetical protein
MAPQTSCATRRSQTAIRTRPASLTHGLRFLVLAVAYMLAGPHPALAAAGDWVLVCPQGSGDPLYLDSWGRVNPIFNPGEKAIAERVCNPTLPQGGPTVSVSVTNNGASTIYVAFTNYSTQQPGVITWTNCTVVNSQVTIPAPNTTCNASVPATAGITGFVRSRVRCRLGRRRIATSHRRTIKPWSKQILEPEQTGFAIRPI